MLAEEPIYDSFDAPAAPTPERRRLLRICPPAPVKIRWAGVGPRSEVTTFIDNISAGGFCVRLMQVIQPGARVFALIEFPHAGAPAPAGTRLAVRGRVLRVEGLAGGVSGVAVSIENHRFI